MGTKSAPGKFDCYARAEVDEPMFVLLARDASAPQLIRQWAAAREVRLALELDRLARAGIGRDDGAVAAVVEQCEEARRIADEMETWRRARRGGK
jgi:hypothetical protein